MNIRYDNIPGYEKYIISDRGNTYRVLKTGKIKPVKWTYRGNKGGNYPVIDCYENGKRKKFEIHRLVAKLFIPPPDSPDKIEVHHKDNDPYNPEWDNLQWCTPRENCIFRSNK